MMVVLMPTYLKRSAAVLTLCMLGGMPAGHSVKAIVWRNRTGKQYLKFYGMSSQSALSGQNAQIGVTSSKMQEGKTVYFHTVDSNSCTVSSLVVYVQLILLRENVKTKPLNATLSLCKQESNVFGKE
ncbi:hypothetical protein O9929_24645 [Vibrio lentus]|nr:hypothetical protein [Vibrio lentus]